MSVGHPLGHISVTWLTSVRITFVQMVIFINGWRHQLRYFIVQTSQLYCSLKEQLMICINWSWTEVLTCRCLARGLSCLTVLAIVHLVIVIVVSQTEAIDDMSFVMILFSYLLKPYFLFPPFIICFCLIVLLLFFFCLLYCVLFVYCDIVYNVFMLSILLWGRCLARVVVVVPFAFLPFCTIVWLLCLYYGTNKVVKKNCVILYITK